MWVLVVYLVAAPGVSELRYAPIASFDTLEACASMIPKLPEALDEATRPRFFGASCSIAGKPA